MLPLSFAHKLITGHAPVEDAWRVLHPDSSIGPADDEAERQRGREIPTALHNLTENGAASDGVFNTWRWPKEHQKRQYRGENITIADNTPDPRAKRLDYIFVGNGSPHTASRGHKWRVHDIKVGMTERHPSIGCSLSDHFSIEATFSRTLESPVAPPNVSQVLPRNSVSILTYDTIISMVTAYTRRQLRQRRFRLFNFILSIVVSIGSFIAIWWSPRPFVAFLLILLSTLGFGAGVLDGLIGGLFIGSELRALKEFEWEIQNAKAIAQGTSRENQALMSTKTEGDQG